MEIFWVEDFLSGEVIENKYYSTREEAAARRNELGYGIVKEWKSQKATGEKWRKRGTERLEAFRAAPDEKIEIT